MTLIAIMQPTYLPWIGYFDLFDQVDHFVFLDDVNVLKRSWGVRNRINSSQGETYLTVPLQSHIKRDFRLFSNTAIDYHQNWYIKHLNSITHAYSKSTFFKEIYDDFEKLLNTKYSTIADLNISIIRFFSSKMGIETECIRSSEIPGIFGRKDERLVNICRALDADQYLSPQGSAAYIESNSPGGAFPGSGVELYYHNYEHQEYPQVGRPLLSHMCIIDLLMNCGYSKALAIIRAGRRKMIHYTQFREVYFQPHETY